MSRHADDDDGLFFAGRRQTGCRHRELKCQDPPCNTSDGASWRCVQLLVCADRLGDGAWRRDRMADSSRGLLGEFAVEPVKEYLEGHFEFFFTAVFAQ